MRIVTIKKWLFWLSFHVVILLMILTSYLSYLNDGTWFTNLAAYSIPFLLISILIGIGVILFLKYYKIFFILITVFILLLTKPIIETFSLSHLFHTKYSKDERLLNVMTFNASTFNNHRNDPFLPDDSLSINEFIDYLTTAKYKPDLLCFQEFHHDDSEKHQIIDEIIKKTGLNYYYTVPIWQSNQDGFFGIITMSRYPIVSKGTLFEGEMQTLNRGIYTDILYKKDTIRIINIHLQSMNIRLNKEDSLGQLNKIYTIIESLKLGSVNSKRQIEQVLNAIENSKYPVLLCGDFNTFPYGYSYQQVKKRLNNSFEKSGLGFGFTLNISPFFVRIDNQFYSKEFSSIESKVIRQIKHSDHFPLISRYIFKP